MNLLTQEIEQQLPALRATDGADLDDKPVVVKFFTPDGNWTWYAFEAERQDDGDVLFFGLVDGLERELGYFALSELQSVRGPMGLPVERDRFYDADDFHREPFVQPAEYPRTESEGVVLHNCW